MTEKKPKTATDNAFTRARPPEQPPRPQSEETIKLNRAENQVRGFEALLSMNAATLRREVLQSMLNPGLDINYECRYPDDITIGNYKAMWDRNGVANRVVRLCPEETWTFEPTIYETEKSDETEFEKVWKELDKKRNLFHYLQRVDILSGIGQFGLLLLGINDGKNLVEPVEGIDLKTGEKQGDKTYELLYLKVFSQDVITVKAKELDVTSPRFGFPTIYTVDFQETAKVGDIQSKEIHWTRVIHVADNRETSETFGVPRMKPVYNRLLDVRKVLGGSAEMFWKGAFPGYSFETNADAGDVEIDVEGMKTQISDYMSGLQRYLAISGITAKSLTPQVEDPKSHLEVQMRNIAITLGIPYRIFLGTEEAHLASGQDVKVWNKRVLKRQVGYATPMIIRPFVDRLIAFGVLPEPKDKEYFVDWPDLNIPGEKEAADIAVKKTEALTKYVNGNVDQMIPPKEFLMVIMGMTEEEAKAIEKAALLWIEAHPPVEPPIPEPGEEPEEEPEEEEE